MGWKSIAQKEKFAEMLRDGKISQKVYDEWSRDTGNGALPDRLHPKSLPKVPKGRRKS